MKSDGKCSICRQNIGRYEEKGFIGEFAHIEDLRKATSRYNSDKTIKELNNESNIILVCPKCHTLIDKCSEEYSTEALVKIKQEYEDNIKTALEYANIDLFSKFSKICKDLMKRCNSVSIIEKYQSIKVEEKINKNSLNDMKDQIDVYMRYIPIFKDFLETLSQIERAELRYDIIGLYRKELQKDCDNVQKFLDLIRAIVGNDLSNVFPAGIIICNYFEECDVFEV